jgi:hypothetical protein
MIIRGRVRKLSAMSDASDRRAYVELCDSTGSGEIEVRLNAETYQQLAMQYEYNRSPQVTLTLEFFSDVPQVRAVMGSN